MLSHSMRALQVVFLRSLKFACVLCVTCYLHVDLACVFPFFQKAGTAFTVLIGQLLMPWASLHFSSFKFGSLRHQVLLSPPSLTALGYSAGSIRSGVFLICCLPFDSEIHILFYFGKDFILLYLQKVLFICSLISRYQLYKVGFQVALF